MSDYNLEIKSREEMFGNLKDMMGKMQEAQQQMEETKKRLNEIVLKEDYGDIKISISGNREIKDLEVDPSLLNDQEELQDKLILAMNKALARANEVHEREMQSVAKGMLPGSGLF